MKTKIFLTLSSSFIFALLTGCVAAPATQTGQATTTPQTTGTAQTTTTQTAEAAQAAQTIALVELLMQQLGITQTQAQTGAGTLFQVAKTQMQPSAFSQLAQAVPGMDTLLAAANTSQKSSPLGGLASATGNSSINNMVGLASAFQQQGLSANMVQQFIPVVLQYVTNTGGTGVANSLSSALVGK